jgi:hypothetical protein
MTKPILLVIAGFFLSTFIFTNAACNKETICKATIKCVDSAGIAVNNAAVLVYATVKTPTSTQTFTADLKANGNTDASGEVKFTFKLPAIYDIRATYVVAAKTYSGAAIIKLEEGKTVIKQVQLR